LRRGPEANQGSDRDPHLPASRNAGVMPRWSSRTHPEVLSPDSERRCLGWTGSGVRTQEGRATSSGGALWPVGSARLAGESSTTGRGSQRRLSGLVHIPCQTGTRHRLLALHEEAMTAAKRHEPLEAAVARHLLLGRRESLALAGPLGHLGQSVAVVNEVLLRLAAACDGCLTLTRPYANQPRTVVTVQDWEALRRVAGLGR
jgi:hypothetical protein